MRSNRQQFLDPALDTELLTQMSQVIANQNERLAGVVTLANLTTESANIELEAAQAQAALAGMTAAAEAVALQHANAVLQQQVLQLQKDLDAAQQQKTSASTTAAIMASTWRKEGMLQQHQVERATTESTETDSSIAAPAA
jgi:predicted  nucleic acid-binding Zn-ribbon protein